MLRARITRLSAILLVTALCAMTVPASAFAAPGSQSRFDPTYFRFGDRTRAKLAAAPAKLAAAPTALPTAPDAFEPDDTTSTASLLSMDTTSAVHNFYTGSPATIDSDYFAVDVVAGRTYEFRAGYVGDAILNEPQIVLEIRRQDDNMPLIGNSYRSAYETAPRVLWTATRTERLIIDAYDLETYFAGVSANTEYQVRVSDLGVVAPGSVNRISGANRFAVAAELAKNAAGTYSGVRRFIICSGMDAAMPDALSASGLAGTIGAPVLLVRGDKTTLPVETVNAIKAAARANKGTTFQFHIVGGPASVPTRFEAQLKAAAGKATIHRISGRNRWEVSANVAKDIRAHSPAGEYTDIAFLACGSDPTYFTDPLIASPMAADWQAPILLVPTTTPIPAWISAQLGYYSYYILVGGDGRGTSRAIYDSLDPASTDWIGGGSREQLARHFADYWDVDSPAPAPRYTLANNLADALTAGSAPTRAGEYVLFANRTVDGVKWLPLQTEMFISGRRTLPPSISIIGGTGSVDTSVQARANLLVGNMTTEYVDWFDAP